MLDSSSRPYRPGRAGAEFRDFGGLPRAAGRGMLLLIAAGHVLLAALSCTGQWTPDRDDAQNMQLIKDLNAYLPPATQQYPSTALTDDPPFAISWRMGQNIHDAALGPVQGQLFMKKSTVTSKNV